VSVAELRKLVVSQLPDPMWPAAYVRMERFPQADNGKVARRALPEPGDGRPELDVAYRAPSTDTERALAKMWRRSCSSPTSASTTPFSILAGDSLRAAEIVSRTGTQFAARVSVADLLASATIASMATLLDGRRKLRHAP
jgi:hypothetical protein